MVPKHSKRDFDVIIVGGGPAGLFAAWHLAAHSTLSVLVVDKGRQPLNRRCPIGQGEECLKCRPCNILAGLGGAGLFSDGKLNFIPVLGKTDLTQFMPLGEAEDLIRETESVFNHYGMDGPVFPTDMDTAREIRKNALRYGVDLLIIRQKHLGSDTLPGHISAMVEDLKGRGVTFHTSEEVRDVLVSKGRVSGVVTNRGRYRADSVVLAPGRAGAQWIGDLVRKLGIPVSQRGIEVGVRVEVHNDIMKDLCEVVYDPTFFVRTRKYDDQTRTFCTNYGGFVALENYQDFVCVNGHANMHTKSRNTNFAFLSKVVLTEPVSDNRAYGESIGRLASLIGGGKPLLQRFGDLRRGRRSTWERIRNSYIEPTMKEVVPGDIAMALPERIVTNLVEGLEKLNCAVPGVANDETLLYAPEIKFFATQVETSPLLETSVHNLFVAGDGPGVAGNIVSASATGLIPAGEIVRRQKERAT
ncbi:MAG: NAD(P)/FAD-dependent oxidoreductase [Desulfohalobiaceae bacterium]